MLIVVNMEHTDATIACTGIAAGRLVADKACRMLLYSHCEATRKTSVSRAVAAAERHGKMLWHALSL